MSLGGLLLGNDPGEKHRRRLSGFASGKGNLYNQLMGEINQNAMQVGANARESLGAQLARGGLSGSGVAFDVLSNADLAEADALNRGRKSLLRHRLEALFSLANQKRRPGLLQSATKLGASAIASKYGVKS